MFSEKMGRKGVFVQQIPAWEYGNVIKLAREKKKSKLKKIAT